MVYAAGVKIPVTRSLLTASCLPAETAVEIDSAVDVIIDAQLKKEEFTYVRHLEKSSGSVCR